MFNYYVEWTASSKDRWVKKWAILIFLSVLTVLIIWNDVISFALNGITNPFLFFDFNWNFYTMDGMQEVRSSILLISTIKNTITTRFMSRVVIFFRPATCEQRPAFIFIASMRYRRGRPVKASRVNPVGSRNLWQMIRGRNQIMNLTRQSRIWVRLDMTIHQGKSIVWSRQLY